MQYDMNLYFTLKGGADLLTYIIDRDIKIHKI